MKYQLLLPSLLFSISCVSSKLDDTDPKEEAVDEDEDGFSVEEDCDDNDPDVYPGAPETTDDGIDQDCDGEDLVGVIDNDEDGFSVEEDCDDNDPDVYPGAPETTDDGIDQDCDGEDETSPIDNDGDGFTSDQDCDDNDPNIYPGAQEICDGMDNNCNDLLDEDPIDGIPYFIDSDGDGYGAGVSEGTTCTIQVGFSDNASDCDDGNAEVHPDATEVCGDNLDNDCDNQTDEGQDWYTDDDGDGYGDPNTAIQDCSQPTGYVDNPDDCSPLDNTVYPTAPEIMGDGIDQDCDGYDALPYNGTEQFIYSSGGVAGVYECDLNWNLGGMSSSMQCSDCDFAFDMQLTYDTSISTASTDCSSLEADESYTYGYIADYDGNGNGALMVYDSSTTDWSPWIVNGTPAQGGIQTDVVSYSNSNFTYSTGYLNYSYQGSSYSNYWIGNGALTPMDWDADGFDNLSDCNDNDSSINPNALDLPYDGIDQDCDGVDAEIDSDGDGDNSLSDCDDADGSIYNGAPEIPNDGIDQDCDGIDLDAPYIGIEEYYYAYQEGSSGTYECDMDWDAFGALSTVQCTDCEFVFDMQFTYDSSSTVSSSCTNLAGDTTYTYGYVEDYDGNGNGALMLYNDSTATWSPWIQNGTPAQNGSQTDVVDFSNGSFTYSSGHLNYGYQGYYFSEYWLGNGTLTITDADGDGVDNLTDCNDADASTYPGATDIAYDGIDQDCDGVDAEIDSDGDGDNSLSDCDDADGSIYNGAPEIPNDGIDQDCDGADTTAGYTGIENFKYGNPQTGQGVYACDITWDALGAASSTTCSSCDFAFDIVMTYDTNSIASSDCSSLETDFSWTYGYVADYDGNGNGALMLYYSSTATWSAWIQNGTAASYGTQTDVVSYSNSNFTYSTGYLDYSYQGSYFSNYWSGNAVAQ